MDVVFDFGKFFEASAQNGPLVVIIVLGLVTLLGKFGVKGHAQTGSALGLGLLFGGAFNIAALGLPVGFAAWFSTVMYGLMMGLATSLGYDAGKELVTKIVTRAIGLAGPDSKG